MSDEGALVEGIFKGKREEEDEDQEDQEEEHDEDEEPVEDKFEEVFDFWQGEGILYEIFRPRKHHKISRRHQKSRHHEDSEEEEDEWATEVSILS